MHLDHFTAPGACMQDVDVLRDDRPHEAPSLELGKRSWAAFGSASRSTVDPLAIEGPDAHGVTPECLDGRNFERIDIGPDPACGAEIRDSALGADPGAGQHHARLPLANESG